jgi:hypothetical protein
MSVTRLKADMYLKRGGIVPTVGLAMYVLYSTQWKSPYTLHHVDIRAKVLRGTSLLSAILSR